MYYVNVINGQPQGKPIVLTGQQDLSILASRNIYPCNYGEHQPDTTYIAGSSFDGQRVTYDIRAYPYVVHLEKAQAQKCAEICTAFAAALAAGCLCGNGIIMDAEYEKIGLLQMGLELANRTAQPTMYLVDHANALHLDIPLADVDAMLTELGINYATLHRQKNERRTAVMAATTVEEVQAVSW